MRIGRPVLQNVNIAGRVNSNSVAFPWLQPVVLFSLTLLTRVPFTSKFLYELDSVQYALGLQKYDVYLHQPQPPGYFLYVMAGKAVDFFMHDPNWSFILISVVTSGLTVGSIFCLGKGVFGREAGLWAAVIAMTSPLFWFYGELALNYVVAAFFNTWTALLCWRLLQKEHRWLYLSPVVLGIAGGVRPDLLIFLLPLWFFCLLRSVAWRRILLAGLILGITVLCWFIPMLVATGGLDRYLLAARQHWEFHNSAFTVWNAGLASRKDVLLTILGYMSYGLGLGAVFLVLSLYVLVRSRSWRVLVNEKTVFFGLWLFPALLFHGLVVLHPYLHRYGIFFLPGLAILLPPSIAYAGAEFNRVAGGSGLSSRRLSSISFAVIVVIVAMNAAVFCLSKTAYSAKTIQEHDRNLAVLLAGIRVHFPSESTVIIDSKSHFFYSYRHIQYYLPEYRSYLADLRVNSRGEKWHSFSGVNGRTLLSDGISLPAHIKYVVYLTDPSDEGYKNQLQSYDLSRISLKNEIVLYYREFRDDL